MILCYLSHVLMLLPSCVQVAALFSDVGCSIRWFISLDGYLFAHITAHLVTNVALSAWTTIAAASLACNTVSIQASWGGSRVRLLYNLLHSCATLF